MSVKMDVKALIVDPIANVPVVILRDADDKNFLPIWVGVFEANAIALQMEGVTTPRPMTHDLLRNVIRQIEGDVTRVVINSLEENTFTPRSTSLANREPHCGHGRPMPSLAPARTRPSSSRRPSLRRAVPGRVGRVPWRRAVKWLEDADPTASAKNVAEHRNF